MSTDYINNPNQRTPCVLVLDISGSMNERTQTGRTRVEELNLGLVALCEALHDDPTALIRVQLSVVTVGGPTGGAEIMMDWTDATDFRPFNLNASGGTPLGKGLRTALPLIEDAKRQLRNTNISYTRPWMIVISDGEPTDSSEEWKNATQECLKAEQENKVEIFSICVDSSIVPKMGEFTSRPPLTLSNMKFRELFVWLSASLSAASRSRPGENISLPSTDPWRNVGL